MGTGNTMGRGLLPQVVGRSDKGGFTEGVGWTFHSAGGFSLLDRNACPWGQGVLYVELPSWTLVFINAINVKRKCEFANMLKGIAIHMTLVVTYCSCDCDAHALLYRS